MVAKRRELGLGSGPTPLRKEFPAAIIFLHVPALKRDALKRSPATVLSRLHQSIRSSGGSNKIFALSAMTGAIIVIPDEAEIDLLEYLSKVLSQIYRAGIPVRAGVTYGTAEGVPEIDTSRNFVGDSINIAARLATAANNPAVFFHESTSRHLISTLEGNHWLQSKARKRIAKGKGAERFTCFTAPPAEFNMRKRFDGFQGGPAGRRRSISGVIVAYDLPGFSRGARKALSLRFEVVARAWKRLADNDWLKTCKNSVISPGGDGGVIVFRMPKGMALALAGQFQRELAEAANFTGPEIDPMCRIGVHYGKVQLYQTAGGIWRPTGIEVFIADEIAGDQEARKHNGVIYTNAIEPASPILEILPLANKWSLLIRRYLQGVESPVGNNSGGDFYPTSEGFPDSYSLESLIGRDREVGEVTSQIVRRRARCVALSGAPGVGKSAIARHVAKGCKTPKTPLGRKFESVVWSSAQRSVLLLGAVRPLRSRVSSDRDVFRHIFIALGAPGFANAVPEKQLAELLRLLRGRRILIVIDDFDFLEGNELLRELIDNLPEGNAFLLTISTQTGALPRSAVPVRIPELKERPSLELLGRARKSRGLPPDRPSDRELWALLGGFPLALEWSVNKLKQSGDFPATKIAAASKGAELYQYLFRHRVIPSVSAAALVVLRVIALFPKGPSREALREIAGLADGVLSRAVNDLILQLLIVRQGDRLLVRHPLIGQYAVQSIRREKSQIIARYLKWAAATVARAKNWEYDAIDYRLLDEEATNLECALNLELSWGLMSKADFIVFASGVVKLLHVQGRWDVSADYCRELLRRGGVPQRLRALVGIALGRHFAHRRDMRQAENFLRRAEADARKIRATDLVAESRMRLGHAQVLASDPRGLGTLRAAARIAKPRSATRDSILGYIADSLIGVGKCDEAAGLLERRLKKRRWPRAEAYFACLLGDAHLGMGRKRLACKAFKRAARIAEEWPTEQRLIGWIKRGIGECQGNAEKIKEAVGIFQALGLEKELLKARKIARKLN